jgi:flagellar biosynthesis/type III secretory pathway chaperone
MDSLLEEALKSNKTFSEKIVSDVENTFINMEKIPEAKSRTEERSSLMTELRELRKKLDKFNNTRNVKTAKYNNSVAFKRNVIRARIAEIRDLLENIKDEEAGSKIDASAILSKNTDEFESTWKGVY